jgi:hypothetical protein
MAKSATTNKSNEKFNCCNVKGIKYRLRAIDNYEFIDEVFDDVTQLVDKYGERFNLNRAKVLRLRQRKYVGWALEKYKNILVTEIEPTYVLDGGGLKKTD